MNLRYIRKQDQDTVHRLGGKKAGTARRIIVRFVSRSGVVIEVFDDSNKVSADVALLHGCLQSCMQNPVEGLLEVYEDMVEVSLVLEIVLTEDS